jgi:CubicO group peptidase (beta-lactamase class C family)
MEPSAHLLMAVLLITSISMTLVDVSAAESDTHALLVRKVDALFAEWDKAGSPGAAVAIVKNGLVIYQKGYGSANLEYDIPITSSTVFHVASVSKQFTAFAITVLAHEGKLSLDDDIRQYLPELPAFGATITIRHLIHHTSGLRDQWFLLAMAGWRLDDVITQAHILKLVRSQRELNFRPGEEHRYSNTGYTLLAEIVERVSGKPFHEWTATHIFEPLGMTSTLFYDDHERIVKNRAYSYQPDGKGGFKKRVLSYANAGATSLLTTVEDLAKWARNFHEARLGGPAVIAHMHERGVLNHGDTLDYAFGLHVDGYAGLKRVGHAGSDAGYRAYFGRFPEQELAIIVLSNLASFNPVAMAMQVVDVYLADGSASEQPASKTTAVPAERKAIVLDPAMYDEYVGVYTLRPGLIITITKEHQRLMTQMTGRPKVELFPESESKFFVKGADVQVSFRRDPTGKVILLTVHDQDQNLRALKFEPLALSVDQLTEYTGNYYSEELGTTYTFVVNDGQLVAQHRRHEDIKFMPEQADAFFSGVWFFGQVKFMRDTSKRITGLKVSNERATNLHFDKQQQ